jgi:hypothetical protein
VEVFFLDSASRAKSLSPRRRENLASSDRRLSSQLRSNPNIGS